MVLPSANGGDMSGSEVAEGGGGDDGDRVVVGGGSSIGSFIHV